MSKSIKNWQLALYYGVLLIVLVSWTSWEKSPNMLLRLVFVALIIAPLFRTERIVTPIIFTFFGIIANNAFLYSYFPTQTIVYVALILTVLLFNNKERDYKFKEQVPIILELLLVLVTLVNLINQGNFDFISASFLMLILLLCFVEFDNYDHIRYILFTFAFASLVLGVTFLLMGNQFGETYKDSDIERGGWMDANYFSTVLGMGVFASVLMLSKGNVKSLTEKVFYVASIAVPFAVMVLNASRGGLLAIGGALIVYLLIGKLSFRYKLLVVFAALVFVLVLRRGGYFELLEYRFMEEGSLVDGSGRTNIWKTKLDSYLYDFTLGEQIFGVGFRNAVSIGYGGLGFHNDFVAMLVEYGAIGFVLFVIMVFQPIFKSSIMRRETIACFTYLALSCFTLEPISSGRVSYYFFYILLLMFSRMRRPLTT